MDIKRTNLLSENYNLREYFLKTNQVPTQSMMKEKMKPQLAAVYFKTMTPKQKVLAGLEPPMKGGGGDWYMPPKDILEGRAVLKPLKKKYLTKLNYLGIDNICMDLVKKHHHSMREEKKEMIADNDKKWTAFVEAKSAQCYEMQSKEAALKNTQILKKATKQFSVLYQTSINKLESLLYEVACKEIKRIQNEARRFMLEKYYMSISLQARRLYEQFRDNLDTEKARLKSEFIENVEKCRTQLGTQIHDIVLDKHIAIEKSRQYMQCISLACQVYVALKEREECEKQIKYAEKLHKKEVTTLVDEIAYRDYTIAMHIEKDKAHLEFKETWKKKVLRIVKSFQVFISYCLSVLPAHADFFINLEKLMLLHLDEVLENPNAESIFEDEEECHEDPRPNPHPYYLCCDKRFTATEMPLVKELCPKCCTSSASHMPVIIINKRLMYTACDNFQQFTNKVKDYMHGHRGDDADFIDRRDYTQYVPVTYPKSQQLLELQLESSLIQILQQEYDNVREVPTVCTFCKAPYCFCTKKHVDKTNQISQTPVPPQPSISKTRSNTKLVYKTNNQVDQYFESYVLPKRCQCVKMAGKHLQQLLPAYMRSKPIHKACLPNYEPCSLHMMKKMVRNAKGRKSHVSADDKQSKSRDVATQYEDEDQDFELLCECLSAGSFQNLWVNRKIAGSKVYHPSITASQFQFIDHSTPSTSTTQDESYTGDKIHSPKIWLDTCSPDIEELFKAK